MTTQWQIPRESREFVGPLAVTVDGTPTTAYEVAVLADGTRPNASSWRAPDNVGGSLGVLVGPGGTYELAPGNYRIWARVTDANPESPVLDSAGWIRIT